MAHAPDRSIPRLLIATNSNVDLWNAPEWFAEKLQKEFPQVEVAQAIGQVEFKDDLASAEILLAQSLLPEQFAAARQLRWIHSPAAAVHQFMFTELISSTVILTNAREVVGPGVAEQVMAMMLAVAKRIPQAVRLQMKHVWGQETFSAGSAVPAGIAGATLGLIGLGTIGRNVARHAHAMDMRIICVREHPEKEKPEFVDEVLPTSQLNEMLGKADYVVLSTPLTPQTRGMIGREQIAAMKADSYLINVGRGPLIDESALVEALRNHRIGGAALDVFDKEPLPADSPFWDLDNVLITPHTAGISANLWERHYALFAENLRRYLSGKPLLGLVDKQSGY